MVRKLNFCWLQQKLLFMKRDTSGISSSFSGEAVERGRQAEITCLLENSRDCIEIKSSFCEIRVN